MTRSSRTRRAKARARKHVTSNVSTSTVGHPEGAGEQREALIVLSKTDKRYMLAFALMSLVITAFYWSMGGRNLFVFPALFCMSVGARKYWSGPVRRLVES